MFVVTGMSGRWYWNVMENKWFPALEWATRFATRQEAEKVKSTKVGAKVVEVK